MALRIKKCRDESEARFQTKWLTRNSCKNVAGPISGPARTDDMIFYLYPEIHVHERPASWTEVISTAIGVLWEKPSSEGHRPICVENYYNYVLNRATHPVVQVDYVLVTRLAEVMGRHITPRTLTPVAECHGDMTLENCLYSVDHEVVFIDPGHPRDLPCRELDESKILQSLDGWEEVKYGRPTGGRTSDMPTRPVHWALLCTHYVRLLRHDHPQVALTFARRRLKEILEMMT